MRVILLAVVISFCIPTQTMFSVQQQYYSINPGKRATDCILSNSTVKTMLFCLKRCITDSECFGINHQPETGLCQHLSKEFHKFPLEDDQYSNLYRRKIDCHDSPCERGKCIDKKMVLSNNRAYTCSCPCGWCGWNCDTINYGIKVNSCIPMYNAGSKIVDTAKECMEFCDETPGCKSADYMVRAKECWLNSVDETQEEIHPNCDRYFKPPQEIWFLAFNCTCPKLI